MGSRGIPSGPSQEEIEKAEQEQERRMRFEDEKRRYLTDVGAYEIMTQTSIDRANQSLEYRGDQPVMPPIESLMIPKKFEPTIDFDRSLIREYEWMEAENLGFKGFKAENFEAERIYNQRYYEALQTMDSWYVDPDSRNGRGMFYGLMARYRDQDASQDQINTGTFKKPQGSLNRAVTDYLNRTYYSGRNQ